MRYYNVCTLANCFRSLFLSLLLAMVGCDEHDADSRAGFSSDGLYVGIYNGRESGGTYSLGVSVAHDPYSLWRQQDWLSPFRGRFDADDSHLSKPSAVKLPGSRFKMFVQRQEQGPDATDVHIVQFDSTNGFEWTNPVNWFVTHGYSPTALYEQERGLMHLWIGGSEGIYYLSSTDCVSWTTPLLVIANDTSNASAWDRLVAPKAAYRDESGYTLFYQGVDQNGWFQGGVASFTNPLGTYHKYAGNPVLPRDVEGSARIVFLAEDGRTAQVQSALGFSEGQKVLILSDTGDWLANEIVAIRVGETLELDRAITLGGNLYVRSYQYSKVYPTQVWRAGGTWHVLGTCFDQHRGIASTGIEFTCKASGVTLDDLRWDRFAVPPFGVPAPHDGRWNSLSIENPTFVLVGGH
jgi:hypothetical protein